MKTLTYQEIEDLDIKELLKLTKYSLSILSQKLLDENNLVEEFMELRRMNAEVFVMERKLKKEMVIL